MFTGIVAERGRLRDDPAPSPEGGVRLTLAHSKTLGSRLEVGASLAVNGVCLTLVESRARASTVELSPETLARTSLGALERRDPVNLEPPLRAGDPLGGHWVQGHVDATVEALDVRRLAEHVEARFGLPREQQAFLVEKGSVCLDGVSLTVSRRLPDSFEVALIPHTLAVTTLGGLAVGDSLNLEVDILAKYVDQILRSRGLVGE